MYRYNTYNLIKKKTIERSYSINYILLSGVSPSNFMPWARTFLVVCMSKSLWLASSAGSSFILSTDRALLVARLEFEKGKISMYYGDSSKQGGRMLVKTS